jgi:hypothetical protein
MDVPDIAPGFSVTGRAALSTRGRPASGGSEALTGEIISLTDQRIETLRAYWAGHFRCPVPPIQSSDTLRRLIAWRLQAEAFGDLDAETINLLRRARTRVKAGKSPGAQRSPQLRIGMILVREWRGKMHRVLVLDEGFEHENERYSTLSAVARKIAGTRWSGPRFFGLEAKSETIDQSELITGGVAP